MISLAVELVGLLLAEVCLDWHSNRAQLQWTPHPQHGWESNGMSTVSETGGAQFVDKTYRGDAQWLRQELWLRRWRDTAGTDRRERDGRTARPLIGPLAVTWTRDGIFSYQTQQIEDLLSLTYCLCFFVLFMKWFNKACLSLVKKRNKNSEGAMVVFLCEWTIASRDKKCYYDTVHAGAK